MNQQSQRQSSRNRHTRTVVSFAGLILLFLFIADLLIVSGQRKMLQENARNEMQKELEVIGTFSIEAMLKNDYATVRNFAELFASQHTEIRSLKTVTPNNFAISDFTSSERAKNPLQMKHEVEFAGKRMLVVEMVKDLVSVEEIMNRLTFQLIIVSLLLAGVFGAVQWYLLRKMSILPLEKELIESHTILLTVLDNLEMAVYVADMETYEIIYVNKRLKDQFGDVRGKICWQTLQAGQSGPCPFCVNNHLLSPDGTPTGVYNWEFQNTVTDVWNLSYCQAIRWLDGRMVRLDTALDISERKHTEDEIRKLNLELEQRVSERTRELEAANKELEAFSYSISHDLRSPLRSIDGFSQAVVEDYGDKLDENGKNYLNRIRAATQRMGRLIDDILKLSRVTRAEMQKQEVDLGQLAEAIMEEIRGSDAGRRVEVRIQQGMTAEGDPNLLNAMLTNLLGNAWKFTGKTSEPRIEFGCIVKDNKNIYFVKDNGAGFDMAYANKLFGAFQRLHSESEFAGTGIGLATVQRIIRRHGGRIWAEGVVNQGSTFYFTLE